jgi:hypothetical protein
MTDVSEMLNASIITDQIKEKMDNHEACMGETRKAYEIL